MIIANKNYTEAQKQIRNIIMQTECMSTWQAMHILTHYFDQDKNSALHLLNDLSIHCVITKPEEKDYICAGGFYAQAKPKRETIEDVGIMLKLMDLFLKKNPNRFEETVDNLKFIKRPCDEFELVYILNNYSIQMIHLTEEKLFMAIMIERTMTDMINRVTINKKRELPFIPVTQFVFGCKENMDRILSKFEEINLQIPHQIIFQKHDSINLPPEFETYGFSVFE